jgi:DNA-binding GntR family transcriptional regulator
MRVKPSAGRTACQIVHAIIDAILARDYEGSVDVLLEHAAAAPVGDPAESDADGGGQRSDEA